MWVELPPEQPALLVVGLEGDAIEQDVEVRLEPLDPHVVLGERVDLTLPPERMASLAGSTLTQQREHDLVLVTRMVGKVLAHL